MSTYKFIKYPDPTNIYDTSTVMVKCETESLDDILEDFLSFLAAAGFSIQPGSSLVIEPPLKEDSACLDT